MAQEDCKGIWVFAEQQNGELNDTVFEILAQALDLKKHPEKKSRRCFWARA